MTKGTPSMGKKSGKTGHFRCRRCGKHAYHIRKKRCASCGYGATTTTRQYAWNSKKKPRVK
ncbi:TPA: 50S ribosomal protein L37e [Candidatus Woesearchaeota archaeon]|nr:50S ribosomal protein L37e [Candidatus Woesearchaeota archaeon]HIG93509.1 50S ribosomal protein L37e [Candidatus Woesearchaeota archaeon]HIH12724.1 50S ribosomal protein L37e [Candidatus Woesearchaeota archaeon]